MLGEIWLSYFSSIFFISTGKTWSIYNQGTHVWGGVKGYGMAGLGPFSAGFVWDFGIGRKNRRDFGIDNKSGSGFGQKMMRDSGKCTGNLRDIGIWIEKIHDGIRYSW